MCIRDRVSELDSLVKDHKARLELQEWHRIYQEEKANIKGRLDVLYWKGETTKRNVSGSMRKRVLERDANCCVVCGGRLPCITPMRNLDG